MLSQADLSADLTDICQLLRCLHKIIQESLAADLRSGQHALASQRRE